jgi:protein involved in polysaccharide export with SLBB domain
MLRRQLAGLIVVTTIVLIVVCVFSRGVAGPLEKTKSKPPAGGIAEEQQKAVLLPPDKEVEKREAQISKMLAEYDLKPQPLPAIPDDPPPHEGAMISLPHLVEPPDLILVEVLDALPGRPISGERLVRPDGKIDIGFYGEIYVRGMTLEQVKVAIVKHLRKYLSDNVLGLETPEDEAQVERPAAPELPAGGRSPLEREDNPHYKIRPRSSSSKHPSMPRTRAPRFTSRQGIGNRAPLGSTRSRIVRVSTQGKDAHAPTPNAIKIPAGAQGKVTITIEFDGQNLPKVVNPGIVPMPQDVPNADADEDVKWKVVPPAESGAVFVDITAYNSKNYYVLGDVVIAGKMPWTGNETVMDILQYAGGLMSSAEPKDIRLVRPGRGGKPAKVYKVDLAAIQEKGDVRSNYQIFPNDRLIVGRNEVVQKTVAMDRVAAPIQTATSSIHNMANMLRAVQLVDQANSDEILKELVDFWAKEVARKGDLKFDEQTLRDALLQKLKSTSAPKQ